MPTPPAAPGSIPPGILCAQDYELLAAAHLPEPTLAYIAGGSGADATVAANRRAFAAWQTVPRLLRDVSMGHTRCQLGTQMLAHPLLLAPLAHQRLAHPQAEQATARAAQAMQAPMVCSTLSSCTLEEIAQAARGGSHWFQLYLQPERAASLDLLRRAEAAGYKAIVLTLDASIQARSQRALHAGFEMPVECQPANLLRYPVAPPQALPPGQSRVFQGLMRSAPRWEDLDWLLAESRLPVWVKGVLHPQDAVALRERGVSGLIVSNHGGRSLDGAPAALAMLPAVRAAVGPEFPLLLDSGVRSGSDVFKALALGANAVLIGRLQVYALSVAGVLGVAHMLRLLCEELEVCMAMTGCASIAEIDRQALVRAGDGTDAPPTSGALAY